MGGSRIALSPAGRPGLNEPHTRARLARARLAAWRSSGARCVTRRAASGDHADARSNPTASLSSGRPRPWNRARGSMSKHAIAGPRSCRSRPGRALRRRRPTSTVSAGTTAPRFSQRIMNSGGTPAPHPSWPGYTSAQPPGPRITPRAPGPRPRSATARRPPGCPVPAASAPGKRTRHPSRSPRTARWRRPCWSHRPSPARD